MTESYYHQRSHAVRRTQPTQQGVHGRAWLHACIMDVPVAELGDAQGGLTFLLEGV